MGPTRLLSPEQVLNRQKQRQEDFEKDETERRLEKLLFGDEAGFLDALKQPHASRDTAIALRDTDSQSGSEQEEEDIENVPDEELFFLDAGMGDMPTAIAQELFQEDRMSDDDQRQPIWIDSDDERITVSLASHTRLRKLRTVEADDMVSGTEYIRRLRKQYERLHPEPEWVRYARKKRKMSYNAVDQSDSDVDMDDNFTAVQPLAELLRSSGALTQARSDNSKDRRLNPEVIDVQRLKDITGHGPSSIDTLEFHPTFPILLSAGPSSTVNMYHISPDSQNANPLLTSLHVKGTPLHTAAFCNPGGNSAEVRTHVFLSSRRRYFHAWSLHSGTVSKVSRPIYGDVRHEQKTMEAFKISPCGRYMGLIGSGRKGGGAINVLSTETKQWICSCRIESQGGVADFAWWIDGNGFVVIGRSGEVSEYDIESRRTLARWIDEGAVGTTVIALGGSSVHQKLGCARWVAVGSTSGVVNVYDRSQWTINAEGEPEIPQRPKPIRSLDQLTTPVSHIAFSADGQLLVISSKWKKNALRLVHLPSCTVYRNWPTDKTPLGRITSLALSSDGGYLAAANEQGKIRLWQIRA